MCPNMQWRESSFLKTKFIFLDFFSTFDGFSVGIKERNHQKKFDRILSKFTVIIQENMFS